MSEKTLREGTRLLAIAGFNPIPCKGDDEYVPFMEADAVVLCFPALGSVALSVEHYAEVCDSVVFDDGEALNSWSHRALNDALGDGAERQQVTAPATEVALKR